MLLLYSPTILVCIKFKTNQQLEFYLMGGGPMGPFSEEKSTWEKDP